MSAHAPSAPAAPAMSGSLAEVFAAVGSSPRGLAAAEARTRLDRVGANEPGAATHAPALRELATMLANPLCVILLLAGTASAVLGEPVNAIIIVLMVVLSVALNFVQSFRSQRAAERLRQDVAPTATVLRDGRWDEVPRRELVPGDLIRLAAGDRVPADARLVETRDLHLQEAALTGESLPVEKTAVEGPPPQRSAGEARHTVFLGTSVVSGTALAVVVATGRATAFGDIAARLASAPPETEFQRGLRRFALLIMRTVLFLVLFVLAASLIMHRPPLESFLFAVALAVGLTPEFLPMITTVTLARGAVRMARRDVIVKHLSAIEDFGSMDVLCSDKTGTLTAGQMTLARRIDPFGRDSERVFALAYLNAANETGIRSPLDEAILRMPPPEDGDYRKVDEIPFDFERRRLSVVLESPAGVLIVTKGAPEGILARCRDVEAEGETRPLDAAAAASCAATHEALAGQGYRVLAVAWRAVPRQAAYAVDDERDMTLAGFVAFRDPPMAGVAEALRALRRDGVTVKILTGDSDLVARHVCGDVGLDAGRIVLGEELDRMTDSALAAVAERTSVFARVSPGQKTRILAALRSRDHVVGFLGDGINDAPSLHAAEVGISVANAVDVAKDAADVILRRRDLAVLHEGIVEGRRAFANVMKYLLMGTSSNFGNMFSMAAAVLFLPFLPMRPTQILLNNFLYDLAQITIPTDNVDEGALARPPRWRIETIRNFMLCIGPISSLFDGLTFWVLLHVFHASEALFQTGWFVESLATQTLVLFVIRTAASPFRSRPSAALVATTALVVAAALVLPVSPLAGSLGFVPLPWAYFAFLAGATVTYLMVVELVKRRLLPPAR
ncbi:MAG: magnesium-translocating P-type ATPase [Candidatus Rokuibacteriota bacterium]